MKVNGLQLNSFQANFVKELMGDSVMTDVRAEALLSRIAGKYDVDIAAMLTAANVRFADKNAQFKKLEAEDAARS